MLGAYIAHAILVSCSFCLSKAMTRLSVQAMLNGVQAKTSYSRYMHEGIQDQNDFFFRESKLHQSETSVFTKYEGKTLNNTIVQKDGVLLSAALVIPHPLYASLAPCTVH